MKYRIEALDKLNWIILGTGEVEKKDGTMKTIEKRMGYFPKLEQAAVAMLDLVLLDNEKLLEIGGLIEAIEDAKQTVIAAVKEAS